MTDRPPPQHRHVWQDGSARHGQAEGQTARTRGPRSRRARAARRPLWLAIAGYGALGVACLAFAAVTFLLVAAPGDLVRDGIVEQVKARTGRDLVVAGPASISIFPRAGVTLSDVSLAAPQGMHGAPTVTMERLDVELRLWRLLSRQIAVKRIVLQRPTIELRVDARGRRSWDFAEATPARVRLAQAGTRKSDTGDLPPELEDFTRSAGAKRAAAALEKLGLEQVQVIDGTVRYQDERAGSSHEIKSLGLALTLRDAASPLEGKGDLAWRGEKVAFEATVSPLGAILDQQPAQLALKVAGPPFEAAYAGSLGLAAGIALDGSVSLKAPSAQALRDWLGKPLPTEQEGALALSGRVTSANGQMALTGLTASLGDASLSGTVSVETRGARPYVKGNLQVSELDFGAVFVRSGKRAGAGERAPAAAAGPGTRQSDPIDDVLRRGQADPGKAPQVRGFTKRAGAASWSDDPIDTAVLGLADADLELSVGRLVYKDLKTGQSRLAVAVKSGVARIALQDMQLYNGRGRGLLTLDGSGEMLVAGANLSLEGVSALPLLDDALSFAWLDGRGNITLALAGQGASERQMVETLNGKVEMAVAGGSIVGIDIPKIVRGLEQGRFGGFEVTPGERTPFSELAASFLVANGTVQNQDMRLVSPHLRVSGAGTASLPQRDVDYVVRAKLAGNTTNPGAVIKVGEIEVPIRIHGPWSKPKFTPDLKAVVKSEQAAEAIKQIGKNLKSQEVQDALKGLLGGDKEQRVKPRELLDKLLKKE